VFHLTQCRLIRCLPPYQVASSSIQPFGCRHGPKIGGCVPFRAGAGSPSDMARAEAYFRIKWRLDPSNLLATIYQRHRQDRQTDNGIERTVLQTVVQRSYVKVMGISSSEIFLRHCVDPRGRVYWRQRINILCSFVCFLLVCSRLETWKLEHLKDVLASMVGAGFQCHRRGRNRSMFFVCPSRFER